MRYVLIIGFLLGVVIGKYCQIVPQFCIWDVFVILIMALIGSATLIIAERYYQHSPPPPDAGGDGE